MRPGGKSSVRNGAGEPAAGDVDHVAAPLLQSAERAAEISRALEAVVDIAQDRWATLGGE